MLSAYARALCDVRYWVSAYARTDTAYGELYYLPTLMLCDVWYEQTGLYSVTVSYLPMRRVVLIWFTMMITAALCSYARVIQCSGRPYHASTHTELTSSSPYGATATGPEERDGKDCASGKCSRP